MKTTRPHIPPPSPSQPNCVTCFAKAPTYKQFCLFFYFFVHVILSTVHTIMQFGPEVSPPSLIPTVPAYLAGCLPGCLPAFVETFFADAYGDPLRA